MSKLFPFVTFTIGALAGAASAWYFAKKKYELIAQEEIDSVKEVYSNKVTKDISNVSVEDYVKAKATTVDEKKTDDIMEYANKLSQAGYVDYSAIKEDKKEDVMSEDKPYIIPPDEYGELDDYECVSLTYYSDEILADDMDELVDDVEAIVGKDSLEHFGEYEDDSVFVRNDALKADYEILLDNRKYSDVIKAMPYRGF